MNTQKSGSILLKFLLLFTLGILLFSCDAHEQEREFRNYLCQCDADGSNFKILCRNDYIINRFRPYRPQLSSYPFKIQHGRGDDLFVFRDDGVFRYDQEDGRWQEYLDKEEFKYRAANYFHPPAHSGEYFFKAGAKLFRVQEDGYTKELIGSDVQSCIGIPFQPHFSVLSHSKELKVENGDIDPPAVTLPSTTDQAYYFTETDLIVYQAGLGFWRCDADGNNAELLCPLTASEEFPRSFYPIDEAGSFVTVNKVEDYNKMLLIDAKTGIVKVLDKISFSRDRLRNLLPFQISRSHEGSKLLFFDFTALYLYDLDSMQTEPILISSPQNYNLRSITSASISADGSKINFICDLYRYK